MKIEAEIIKVSDIRVLNTFPYEELLHLPLLNWFTIINLN
jgi:hypothetical protein